MATEPSFRASGLASGIDTAGLVDKLMAIEARPLDIIKQQKAAIAVQISSIGSLVSKLKSLESAATTLKNNPLAQITASGTYSDFTVSGSSEVEGRFSVRAEFLAQAAKMRSQGYLTNTEAAATGDLKLSIDGSDYTVTNLAGKNIRDVAYEINQQVSKVTASVVSDGTSFYLTIARKETGHTIGAAPATALSVVNGFEGGLSLATTHTARNAIAHVDGLQIERRSNEIRDVISGVTINLKAASNTETDVVFSRNVGGTASGLQKFTDAFNEVAKLLKAELRPEAGVTNSSTSIGSSTLIGLQNGLQKLISKTVNSDGAVRTLSDLGVRLSNEGLVTLDQSVLDDALERDPAAVNAIFAKATDGIGQTVKDLVKSQTHSTTGMLVSRQKSLENANRRLDDRTERLQRTLDARREQLVQQFTSMEKIMNNFMAIGSYLQSQTFPGFSNNSDK